MIEFLIAVLFTMIELALLIGTLAGLFLLACFCVGWVIEAIRRLK